MARGANVDLSLVQGKTFIKKFRWAAEPSIFKAITAVSSAPPATFTVAGHGLPPDWAVSVTNAAWAKSLNAVTDPPSPTDYRTATVVDANTISFDGVNSAGWVFKAGGYIRFYTPAPLANYSARLQIKDRIGGTVLLSLSSPSAGIEVDNVTKTITITIEATATDPVTWDKGVYDLELFDNAGTVVELAYGKVSLFKQVTT